MRKAGLLILLCIFASGCVTFGDTLPVLKATGQQPVETQTIWVNAKTKKIWVNPHVDEEGNMIEGHYKYVVLEKGHWALQEIAPEDAVNKDESK